MSVDNNKAILDFKCFVPERVKELIKLLQDSEVQTFLNQLDDTEQLSRLMEMAR
jgi:hypothetical protein